MFFAIQNKELFAYYTSSISSIDANSTGLCSSTVTDGFLVPNCSYSVTDITGINDTDSYKFRIYENDDLATLVTNDSLNTNDQVDLTDCLNTGGVVYQELGTAKCGSISDRDLAIATNEKFERIHDVFSVTNTNRDSCNWQSVNLATDTLESNCDSGGGIFYYDMKLEGISYCVPGSIQNNSGW